MNQPATASIVTGDIINQRYRIASLLGRGGMGFVYLVEDLLHQNKQLALKTLRIERLNEALMELFKEEFRLLTKLNHPNIARVYDFGFTWKASAQQKRKGQEGVFFTSEYIPGVDLFQATADVPLKIIYELCVQICRALEYIGSRGIIHGDLKSGNILVDHQQIKIVDFGIAREFLKKQHGTLSGTPKYMAPEVIRGEAVDSRSDLYSLGVILYTLVTRKVPFDGRNPDEILSRQLEETPLPPRRIRKDLPHEFERIILRLLEKDPGDRFFRANQIIEELSRFSDTPYAFETKETQEGYILSGKFVGRNRELNRLREYHRDLFARKTSTPNLCIVSGERGSGKTKVLKEFKNYLQVNHVPVFSTELSMQANKAYGTFISLLQQIIGSCPEVLVERYRKPLARFLPMLPENDGATEKESSQPELETYRLYETVTQFLIESASVLGRLEKPGFALFFDNIEELDQENMELFLYLFRTLNQSSPKVPLLLFATLTQSSNFREPPANEGNGEVDDDTLHFTGQDDSSISYSGKSFLEGILDDKHVYHLTLNPLHLRDIQDLIRSMTGGDFGGPNFAPQLEQITKGNPLYIHEIMKSLLDQGQITVAGDVRHEFREIDLHNLSIPKSLEEIVQERCQNLSESEQIILEAMATINRPVSAEVLASLTSLPLPSIFKTLNMLKSRSDLQMDLEEGEVFYRISKEYLLKIVYDRIPVTKKRSLHLAYAQYLESKAPESSKNIEALAQHYIRAGAPQQASDYALKAASQCTSAYAYRAAVEFYEAALKIVETLPHPDFALIEKIHKELAHLCRYLGDFTKSVHYLKLLTRLLHDHDALPQRLIPVYRQLGEIFQLMGKPQDAVDTLERASELLRKHSDIGENLRVLWIRGRILYRQGHYERLFRESEEGLALAESTSFRAEYAEILCNRGLAFFYRGDYEAAVQDFQNSLEHFEELNLLSRATYPINCLGVVRYKQGKIDEAIEHFKRAYEVSKHVGDNRHLINFAMNIGATYHQRQEFRMAIEYYERALAVSERINHPTENAKILSNLGLLFNQCSHLEKGEELVRRSLAIARQHHFREIETYNLIFLGEILAEREEWNQALQYFEDGLAIAKNMSFTQQMIDAYHGIVLVNVALKDFSEARLFLKKAKEGAKKLGARETILENHLRWSDFFIHLLSIPGETPERIQKMRALCRKHLLRAQKLAQEAHDIRRLWEIYFHQGRFLTLIGQNEAAAKRLQRAAHLANQYAKRIPEEYRHYFQSSTRLKHLRQALTFFKKGPAAIISKPSASTHQESDSTFHDNVHALSHHFSKRHLRKFLRLVQQLNLLEEGEKWFHAMFDFLLEVGNCERLIVFLEENGELIKKCEHFAPHVQQKKPDYHRDFAQMVFEMGVSILSAKDVADIVVSNRTSAESLHDLETLQLACIPLRHQGKILGVLYLDRYRNPKNPSPSQDLLQENQAALEMLSNLISLGLLLYSKNLPFP